MHHCSKYRMGLADILIRNAIYVREPDRAVWRLEGDPMMCAGTAAGMLRYTRAVSLLEATLMGWPG